MLRQNIVEFTDEAAHIFSLQFVHCQLQQCYVVAKVLSTTCRNWYRFIDYKGMNGLLVDSANRE